MANQEDPIDKQNLNRAKTSNRLLKRQNDTIQKSYLVQKQLTTPCGQPHYEDKTTYATHFPPLSREDRNWTKNYSGKEFEFPANGISNLATRYPPGSHPWESERSGLIFHDIFFK